MLEIVELPSSDAEAQPPKETPRDSHAPRLTDIYVIFTTADETMAALRVAADLAQSSDGSVRLVDFRVVPVGAPVEAPTGRSPIEMGGFLDRVRTEGIDVRANVYVCRSVRCAVPEVFRDRSLIVLGGRHHWWSTRTGRLRQILERAGHFVLLVDGAARRT